MAVELVQTPFLLKILSLIELMLVLIKIHHLLVNNLCDLLYFFLFLNQLRQLLVTTVNDINAQQLN